VVRTGSGSCPVTEISVSGIVLSDPTATPQFVGNCV
jgi:hypothetical protein